jgi:hypothetical protein
LKSHEQRPVAEVGWNAHDLRVAAADHLGVDHRVAYPHVGEQAPVLVTTPLIELESHLLATDQLQVDPPGRVSGSRRVREVAARPPRAVRAMRALVRVRNLGRVDPEVADFFDARTQLDVDGVTVHDEHDAPGGRRRRRRRDGGEQSGGHERTEHGAPSQPRARASTPRIRDGAAPDPQCHPSRDLWGRLDSYGRRRQAVRPEDRHR